MWLSRVPTFTCCRNRYRCRLHRCRREACRQIKPSLLPGLCRCNRGERDPVRDFERGDQGSTYANKQWSRHKKSI